MNKIKQLREAAWEQYQAALTEAYRAEGAVAILDILLKEIEEHEEGKEVDGDR